MKYVIGILFSFIAMVSVGFAQEYVLFYGNGCPHCAQVASYIQDNDLDKQLGIVSKEIYFNKNNLEELRGYLQKLGLDTHQITVPFLVINAENECSYVNGSSAIIDFLEKKNGLLHVQDSNLECNRSNCDGLACEDQTLEDIDPIVKDILTTASDTVSSSVIQSGSIVAPVVSSASANKRGFFAIMLPAALSDSINPCAFAVMLLLLSTILSRHQSRRKTLLAGGLFALAVFLSYFAMGLGIFSALANATNVVVLKIVVGVLGLLVGLANVKDYFWYGKLFVMEVPMSRRPRLQDVIHRVSSPLGAFAVGLLVSVFLLPCSSGPYFTILGFLSSEAKSLHNRGLRYLIVYNLIFVLPMLIIAILVGFGWASVDKLAKLKHQNTRLIHLIVGLLMLGLGIYVLMTI